MALAALAASPLGAADPGPASAAVSPVVVKVDRRTGKLVRSAAVPAPRTPPRPEISKLVEAAAQAHRVDPLLVDSVIQVESGYNPYAVSSKGAEGLMQLMPSTARSLGVSNPFDPRQNIEAGVKYLKQLQELYKDDRLALAAYNAGPGAVDKYKWIPPFRETQNYVRQVGQRYDQARSAARPAPAAPQPPVVEQKKQPEHPRLEQFVDEHGRLHLRTAQ